MTPRLDGSDRMPWGMHKGRRLDSVPLDYWQWCLNQEWFREQYDLYDYARCVAPPSLRDGLLIQETFSDLTPVRCDRGAGCGATVPRNGRLFGTTVHTSSRDSSSSWRERPFGARAKSRRPAPIPSCGADGSRPL